MDFSFSEEQVLLRDSLRKFLDAEYGFEARRASVASAAGWRREIWSAMARDLGLFSVALPAEAGGHGGGAVEHMIIMEELGRALVVEPYLETVVIGVEVLSRAQGEAAARRLREAVAGECVLAFAWAEPGMRYAVADIAATAQRDGRGWRLDGRKSMVTAAPWADALIVVARTRGSAGDPEGLSLFLADKDSAGLTTHDYPTIDGRRASDVIFDGVRLPGDALLSEEGAASALIEEVIDRAIAALCGEAVGVARRLLADTIAYTNQRWQFGQPLSGFQALQHRMVDMFIQTERAVSASYLATLRLGSGAAERARAVSAAKVTVGQACHFVGANAVQLHGGMGMTDELPIGHYFKRALMIETEFGDVDHHRRRHAALSAADLRNEDFAFS